ncbi:hypothetical protein FQN49_008970 [Arthroderma sp. PD_2]|nr:hypothetical protein FQN49_008970 [Arthroderma sp. PD_2]
MSPAAMNEESRRDLIARQHRALYGNDSAAQTPTAGPGDDSHTQQAGTPTAGIPGGRGASPRGVDPFLGQSHSDNQTQGSSSATGPTSAVARSRSPTTTASPPSNTNKGTNYGVFEPNQQQQTHSTTSPAGKGATDSSPSRVGPIGSRPTQQQHQPTHQQQHQQQPATNQSPNPSLSLRSTTPLPSPLSYGFSPNEANQTSTENGNGAGNGNGNGSQSNSSSAANRSASGASGQSMKESSPTVGLGWGKWGTKSNQLGVQASVWG